MRSTAHKLAATEAAVSRGMKNADIDAFDFSVGIVEVDELASFAEDSVEIFGTTTLC